MGLAPHHNICAPAWLAAALLLATALAVLPPPLRAQEAYPATITSMVAADAGEDDHELLSAQRQIDAGRFHEAIATLQALDRTLDDTRDTRRRARVLGTLGIALNFVSAYGEAIEVQHRALALYESLDNPAGITAVTLNLGSSLSGLGDVTGARRNYERALALKRAHGITKGVGAIHHNLAELAEQTGDLDTAEAELKHALEAHAIASFPSGESITRANLARLLARKGQHEAALEQLQLGETLAHGAGSARAEAAIWAAHAAVLMQQVKNNSDLPDDTRARSLTQAEHALQRALASHEAQENPRWRVKLLESLSELHEVKGEPEAALERQRTARTLDNSLRQRTDLARAGMLSAGYENARQQREIHRLQGREARSSVTVMHQRRGLFLMAALLLTSVGLALLLWHRNRMRHSMATQLHQHNQALSRALEQAQRERQRAEAFAMRQRRFLRLASEDLRGPLLAMRTLAERALVEESPEARRRTSAVIAQNAADLLWVTEQMLESASQDDNESATPPAHEPVDLLPVLREIVDQAMPRALHFDQHIALRSTLPIAPVQLERIRCTVALRELLDILLFSNPPRTHFILSVRENGDDRLRLGISAGVVRLPDWQDIAMGHEIGDVTLRLALAWIQHTIQDNGGEITTERDEQENRREIVIRFPRGNVPEAPPD